MVRRFPHPVLKMESPFLTPDEYDERAHRLYDTGEYEGALEVLREGLDAFPEAAELHVGIGYVRIAREEFVWARQAFEAALACDAETEDAWVGLGEVLLKFGQYPEALECFDRAQGGEGEQGEEPDLEIGLAIGRALYREGLYHDARRRFASLVAAHEESADARAAYAYTLHVLGDDVAARRELRRALRLDPELHEARIYLAHILYDRGQFARAMRELEAVPPEEHWDVISIWRLVELRHALTGVARDDASLSRWHERIRELEVEPDAIDHLLAEVEIAFEEAETTAAPGGAKGEVHCVRTAEGAVLTGSWVEIVEQLRDRDSGPGEPIGSFMRRSAERLRELTGQDIPSDTAEAFVRGSARLGLIRIEGPAEPGAPG